jgi:glycosyltransferase involved in cell wall biosynthesis
MKRILQAIAGADQGGAEEFFVRLVLALRRREVPQAVLLRPNDQREIRIRQAGLEPIHARFGGMLDFATVPRIKRAIDTFQPDVVLSWMSRASHFVSRARGGRGFVHVGRLGGYYDLKYYSGCDHLIGNTPDVVDYLVREGWNPARAHFVPNFVDEDPAPPARRADFGTPDDARLVLAAGRFHRNKAFDVLIRALVRLPGVYLWLAGDGEQRDALNRLAVECGVAPRVRFLGWRADMPGLMAAADVLACPSRVEPFGNVIVEAWARGLPVVAAASAGPAWLVKSGENGLLVPMENPDALADALGEILVDAALARRMAVGGHAAYRRDFAEDIVVGRYLDLFERIVR